MRFITALLHLIDQINQKVSKFFAWSIVLLILGLVYEVVLRYIFKNPTLWSYDVTYMLSSLMLVMGIGYTFQVGGHVNVDFISSRLPGRVRALLNVIFALSLFFFCWIFLLNKMIPHLEMSWSLQERAKEGTWLPPIYPYKTWLFAGVALLVLQGIAEIIRDLVVLVTGGERP